jgi:hypothetical protein
LSFTQYTRELGEESVVSNDNAQCASVRIYTCTRRLLLFASLVMGICIHIRSLIHHAIFFFSFFLFLPFFFLMLARCTTRRQMSSKVACLDGNVI